MTAASTGSGPHLDNRGWFSKSSGPSVVHLLDLPRTDYQEALNLQMAAVQQCVQHGGPDVLILVEHPPTITLGTRGNESDLLVSTEEISRRGICFHRSNRGGAATFHGPGQIVCYPIIRLKAYKLTVRAYVHALEQVVIQLLNEFGVTGVRVPKHPGVWIDELRKIASIGVRITRGVAYHGFSINVDLKTDPHEIIVSCGLPEVHMVSLADFVGPVDERLVRDAIVRAFAAIFHVQLLRIPSTELTSTFHDS